jgi:hypothetical protein
METIDKLLILAGTLEVCMDRISSGHTDRNLTMDI